MRKVVRSERFVLLLNSSSVTVHSELESNAQIDPTTTVVLHHILHVSGLHWNDRNDRKVSISNRLLRTFMKTLFFKSQQIAACFSFLGSHCMESHSLSAAEAINLVPSIDANNANKN